MVGSRPLVGDRRLGVHIHSSWLIIQPYPSKSRCWVRVTPEGFTPQAGGRNAPGRLGRIWTGRPCRDAPPSLVALEDSIHKGQGWSRASSGILSGWRDDPSSSPPCPVFLFVCIFCNILTINCRWLPLSAGSCSRREAPNLQPVCQRQRLNHQGLGF